MNKYLKTSLLLGSLATSIATNVTLFRTNQHLTSNIAGIKRRQELQPGVKLPALNGTNRAGEALSVAHTTSSQRTLLLVFSPSCPYCAKNWPNWERLVSAVNPQATRVVAVDLSGKADFDYLRAHKLEGLPVFATVDHGTTAAYNLRLIPTTMLIGGNGTLERTWAGPLTPEDTSALEKTVRTTDPACCTAFAREY